MLFFYNKNSTKNTGKKRSVIRQQLTDCCLAGSIDKVCEESDVSMHDTRHRVLAVGPASMHTRLLGARQTVVVVLTHAREHVTL